MSLDAWLAASSQKRRRDTSHRELRPQPARPALIDLAGNDYLGLRTDPRVTRAAADAALSWGAGAGASRLVTGTLDLHTELETTLAAFTGHPAALVFSTGYQANLAAVTALSDKDTLIVSDAHVHASLVDACRLARPGGLAIVAHNDVDAVLAALRGRRLPRALVLVESVYSVLGDAAPLVELASLAAEYAAVLVVDEAHSVGVAGPGGRGLAAAAATELANRPDLVATLTLSKALGAQGGAVLGSLAVREHLVNTARPFIFDTGLAPASAAGALEAVRVVTAEPELPSRARRTADRLAHGLGTTTPAGCVVPVAMPSPRAALAAQATLAADGYSVGCFRPPSVPDGVSRLRLTARATLTDAVIDDVTVRVASLTSGPPDIDPCA